MGILVSSLLRGGGSEKDLQLTFGQNLNEQVEMRRTFFPAEWYPQSGVQLTWPHEKTDWAYMLAEVQECFANIAREITAREPLLIIAPEVETVRKYLQTRVNINNIRFFECLTNDTWARDHGPITLMDIDSPLLLDFCFNGWGKKFVAHLDNQITEKAFRAGCFKGKYNDCTEFVLEGGSIESDGAGTLLTTSMCLLAPNRNETMNRAEIEEYLKSHLHVQQILWLDHGYLAGDDTDSHVDTLARLCPDNTIVYVACSDPSDEHYEELKKMKEQLITFRTLEGKPFRLLPLPMAEAIYEDGERLPATYANFLVINGAVLYPTYCQPENDCRAAEVLAEAFPGREIIGIDCRPLIRQHGSLHCVTMQFPQGVLV